MDTCPTCESGIILKMSNLYKLQRSNNGLNTDIICKQILQHIYDDTLYGFHSDYIPYLFFDVSESTRENLEKWIEVFGIPPKNLYLGRTIYEWSIPEENLIYLFNIGFDLNSFFPNGRDIEKLHIISKYGKKMHLIEKLKFLKQHSYVMSPNTGHRLVLFDRFLLSDTLKLQKFEHLIDLLDLTKNEAKKIVNEYLYPLDDHDHISLEMLPYVTYLSKKYDLGSYIRGHRQIEIILKFNESLD